MKTLARGFTLVEMMVAVAVIAIIAAVAMPSIENMRASRRVHAAAEAVYSHAQFTRNESIKEDQNLFLSITTGTNWCLGISLTTGCSCATAGSCQFGTTSGLSEHNLQGTDFPDVSLSSSNNNIEFDSRRGTTIGGGSTITLSGSNGYSAQVIVSALGRARLCGNVGGLSAC
jgi:type IV fimbrial biogenesis protein FimT